MFKLFSFIKIMKFSWFLYFYPIANNTKLTIQKMYLNYIIAMCEIQN